jgi:tetratricopeptide (TPR) repeat protein
MAVKRVSDSYAKGLQAFAGARRTPSSQFARAKADAARALPTQGPANRTDYSSEATDAPAFDIAAGIAQLHAKDPAPSGNTPVDYQEIIASTLASLDDNSAEARHAVYDHARQVIDQTMGDTPEAVSPIAIAQARAALDEAIEKVEADAHLPDLDQPATPGTIPAPAPAIAASRAKRAPPVATYYHGALRLAGMMALICVVLFGYWLLRDRSEPRRPAESVGAPVDTPAASRQTSSPDAAPSEAHQTQVAVKAETAAPDESSWAEQLNAKPLPNSFTLPCSGDGCAPGTPNNLFVTAAGAASSQSWLADAKLPPRNATAALTPAPAAAGKAAVPSNSYERGLEQAKGGDPELAVRYFTQAIRANPNFSDGYLQRGNMRFKNGDADLAILDFDEAIRTDPRNAAAYKARGMVVLYKGDEDTALDDLTHAIQIAEADPTRLSPLELFFARRSRAAMFGRRKADERELFDLSAMVDAYWKNPDLAEALKTNYGTQGAAGVIAVIYRQRAALYQQRANTDGAVADLSLAAQLDPTHATLIVTERARVQEAAGRREQALADYKRVLALNPRHEEARQAIQRLSSSQP